MNDSRGMNDGKDVESRFFFLWLLVYYLVCGACECSGDASLSEFVRRAQSTCVGTCLIDFESSLWSFAPAPKLRSSFSWTLAAGLRLWKEGEPESGDCGYDDLGFLVDVTC